MKKAKKREELELVCCMPNCNTVLTKETKATGVRIDICKRCLISLQNDNS